MLVSDFMNGKYLVKNIDVLILVLVDVGLGHSAFHHPL